MYYKNNIMPRKAVPALAKAEEAISLMKSILGDVPLPESTPMEALKSVRKAQYKQKKYESDESKNKAHREQFTTERVKKPENAWIQHVKRVQTERGISYKDALRVAKETYRRV